MEYRDALSIAINMLLEKGKRDGKSASGLACACGVKKQSVYKWRRGISSMDVERVPGLCRYFGITPTQFFGMADSIFRSGSEGGDRK